MDVLSDKALADPQARRWRAHAEWFLWARRTVTSDSERSHAAAATAMNAVDSGLDSRAAANAAKHAAFDRQFKAVAQAVDAETRIYASWWEWAARWSQDPDKIAEAVAIARGAMAAGADAAASAHAARMIVQGPQMMFADDAPKLSPQHALQQAALLVDKGLIGAGEACLRPVFAEEVKIGRSDALTDWYAVMLDQPWGWSDDGTFAMALKRVKQAGAANPETVGCFLRLGHNYRDRLNRKSAAACLRIAYLVQTAVRPADRDAVAVITDDLASVYADLANLSEAHHAIEQASAWLLAKPSQLDSFEFVALDHPTNAERILTNARANRELALGSENPLVAASLYCLGMVYMGSGRFDKAAEVIQRCITIRELSQRSRQSLAFALNVLSDAQMNQGLANEAMDTVARCIVAIQEVNPRSGLLVSSYGKSAIAKMARGNLEDADKLNRAALSIAFHDVDDSDTMVRQIVRSEVEINQKLGRDADVRAFEGFLASLEDDHDDDDPKADS